MNTNKWLLVGLAATLLFSCKKRKDITTEPNPSVKFEKSLGGALDDQAKSVLVKNNALYVFGTTKSFGEPNGDHYLLKLDLNGNILFEKTYGGALAEEGFKILTTKDGNLLLVGSTESTTSNQKDVHVIKVDTAGNLLWENIFGGPLDDWPNTVIETSRNEFCIVGTTESYGAGARDIYLIWVNQDGNLLSEIYHGESGIDGGADLLEVENNNLLLFGYTENYGAVNRDLYLLKMNSLGDSIWAKIYGGNDYEESQKLVKTQKGDFLLHGHSASTDPIHDMYTVKVDNTGNPIWAKNYGGTSHDGGQAMLINSEGNYVLIARSTSFGAGDRNIYMVTTNTNGDVLSEEVLGGSKADWGQDILEHQGHYYIVGHSNSFSHNNDDDVYVVKYGK